MDYSEMEKEYIANTYTREPLTISEGKGMKVKDEDGNEYLDFVAGLAVCSLGHSNPSVAERLSKQSKKLVHVSNLYGIREQAELGKKLAGITPDGISKFFFCNSGTEAVEAALKLAVKHTGRDKILALEKSFHGRTSASVGVTWKNEYKDSFKPLISSSTYSFTPLNDLEEAKKNIDENTAAFIAEPVQGEGGVNVLSEEFVEGVREICDENGTLYISDEVQAGMCRTGKWFACQHWDLKPDIITMAKALGNGFPVGAMGAKKEVMDSFQPGDHASTFGGNPLACSVAKTVVETMQEEDIPGHVREVGGYFKGKLKELSNDYEMIQEVRGRGLMLAIVLDGEEKAEEALKDARKDGFLINCTSGNVLRFVPPLIVEKKHVDKLIKELDEILGEG